MLSSVLAKIFGGAVVVGGLGGSLDVLWNSGRFVGAKCDEVGS